MLFEVFACLVVGVHISGLAEEVGTETFVRVVEDSVLVGVVEGGSILDNKLDLPDAVSLVSLG